MRERGSGPSCPLVSSGSPVLLSRKSSRRPGRVGEAGGGAAWGSSFEGEGEGCGVSRDPQAAVGGGFSFPGRDGGSLKYAEISANRDNKWGQKPGLNMHKKMMGQSLPKTREKSDYRLNYRR